MYENQVSYKTKQLNLLRSKTQSFLKNYNESSQRVKSGSSMHKLAKTIYSIKQNLEMSPKKIANNSISLSKSQLSNPELQKSQIIKGLNMRVSHVPNYSDINTELLLEKKNLEQRIIFLKANITKQQKLQDQATTNNKKLNNQLEKLNNSLKQLRIKSERLNQGIQEANDNCSALKISLKKLKANNKTTCIEISNEMTNCRNNQAQCINLKKNLLIQDKLRVNLKNQLIKQQRLMNSFSILAKQLEHQRAVLLLSINKAVSQNLLA